MTVADALESVYEKISDVLAMINGILSDKMIDTAVTFYDLPDRISMVTGADEIIDGTAIKISGKAKSVKMYKFYHDEKLASASFPLADNIGECAFSDCKNLSSVNMPKTTFIGGQAFARTGIVDVYMPMVVSTGGSVFTGCQSLLSATFPSLRIIESGMFYDCTKLETVDLSSVESISANSFTGCSVLRSLIIRKNGPCFLASVRAFDNSGIANGTGFIYVPQDSIGDYIGATNWTAFRSRIRPIESYPDITGYTAV